MSIRNIFVTMLTNTGLRRCNDLLSEFDTPVEAVLYKQMQGFLSDHPESKVQKRIGKNIRGVRKGFVPITGCA